MTDHHSEITDDRQNPRATPTEPADETVAQATTTQGKKSGSMVREVIETLLLALLIFVAVRAVVLNFRVDGHSMDSALADNEMLLVNRNAYFALDQETWLGWLPGTNFDDDDSWRPFGIPERGDIVVLNPPSGASADQPYIKRVIGLPGDRFEVRNDHVYINDIELVEPYLDAGTLTDCGIPTDWCGRGPIEIPEGSVMVLGDNRNNSDDSRSFGPVPIDNIIGKAWITYWPSDNIGIADHFDYPELDGSAAGAQWERSVAGWPASSQVGGAHVGHGV
jgi:signal peptidase I